jgi:predicted helicase
LLQLLITVICTIVATIFLIPQYLENQKWKIYEFLAREVKEFETRQETINVMRMLDGDDRSIKLFPDSDNSKNKFVIVKKKGLCDALSSLEDQDLDQDIQKPRKADQAYINAAIRDNFDKVLDNLERFNNLIESKVVTKEGLRNYIESWLEIIHDQADTEVKKKLWLYIEKRKFSGVQKLFERYNRPIYPQAGDDEPPSPPSELIVTRPLANENVRGQEAGVNS